MIESSNKKHWPSSMLAELDRFVVGQEEAKRILVTAFRDRQRRMQVSEPMRSEMQPRNVLLIGATGIGKTELVRRLADLGEDDDDSAPMIKVEATKYTEVGYMGRDVEHMVRDLVERTVARLIHKKRQQHRGPAEEIAIAKVLESLGARDDDEASRADLIEKIKNGSLDKTRVVDVPITQTPDPNAHLIEMFGRPTNRRKTKKLKPTDALHFFQTEELNNIDTEGVVRQAIEKVENHGIIFIDEIDKICEDSERHHKGGVSREGVQRDLLPIVEGTDVQTKYGNVRTHHILFIGSGAFQTARPEDLIPELQGRFPVVVNMKSLTQADFVQILSTKEFSLIEQYKALVGTDDIELVFTPDGIELIAETAVTLNYSAQDTGARRLHGLMENLTQEIRFDVGKYAGQTVTIDKEFVMNFRKTSRISGTTSRCSIL